MPSPSISIAWVGDKRQFAFEAMVLDGGRTDIYLISYLSTSTVEEMWQA